MAKERPRIGRQVMAKITYIKGNCGWGHKVGDEFEISCHDNAGLCGFFYHDAFPMLQMLQFDGKYPWGKTPDSVEVECADRHNVVKMELRRV